MTDADSLVTVASFDLLYKAELARGILEDNGIRSFVADGETVNTNWIMSGALGGVKLQVMKAEFLAAERALNSSRNLNLDDYGLTKSISVTTTPQDVRDSDWPEDQDEGIEPTVDDLTVDRALKCAIIGLVFLPPLLHFYSVSLLIPLSRKKSSLRPDTKQRFQLALTIDVIVFGLAVLFLITCCVLFVQKLTAVSS